MALAAATGLLTCPHCRLRLDLEARTARCAAGHSFDIARQGYLNLLTGPQPANADTAAMLQARQRIQRSGLFDQVASLVAGLARGRRVLEVGAGTAHYLGAALGIDPDARGVALDVSTAAARIAGRADERIAAVVADVWQGLPIASGSVDVVLSVFAPRNIAEFARVLAPGGRLVVVAPLAGHLAALREHHGLLGIEPAKQERLRAQTEEFFDLIHTDTRVYSAQLDTAQAADLIGMGPNAFHDAGPTPTASTAVRIEVVAWVFTPLVTSGMGED